MKFYISDLHIGHKNAISFDERPFWNIEEQNEEIIKRWNEVVTKNDDVYILGDFAWKNDMGLEVIRRFNGRKYLINGNHDRINEALLNEFEWVKDYAEIKDGGENLVLFHYPIAHWKNADYGSILLYGHIHGATGRDNRPFNEYKEAMRNRGLPYRCYNVGCMLPYMNYQPRTLKYIIENAT